MPMGTRERIGRCHRDEVFRGEHMLVNTTLICLQNAARLRVERYRELAILYRSRAERESFSPLRQRLQTLAVEYEEIAHNLSH